MTIFATIQDVVDILWASTEETEAPLPPSSIAADSPLVPPGGDVPPFVPSDQLYYWTAKWQADQNESLRELEAGHSRLFTSADAAILWLVGPTDD